MKLQELNQDIATACETKPRLVLAVQKETFRRMRDALAKGEKIQVADFGIFAAKDVPAEGDEPARKAVRFKLREEGEGGESKKERRAAKKQAKTGFTEGEPAAEGAAEPAAAAE